MPVNHARPCHILRDIPELNVELIDAHLQQGLHWNEHIDCKVGWTGEELKHDAVLRYRGKDVYDGIC